MLSEAVLPGSRDAVAARGDLGVFEQELRCSGGGG